MTQNPVQNTMQNCQDPKQNQFQNTIVLMQNQSQQQSQIIKRRIYQGQNLQVPLQS